MSKNTPTQFETLANKSVFRLIAGVFYLPGQA